MRTDRLLRCTAILAAALSLTAGSVTAQDFDADDWLEECREERWGDDHERYCEVRELTLSADAGALTVDGRQNGGISVEGWDRDEVRVFAKISAWGDEQGEARGLAERIEIRSNDARVWAEGPRVQDDGGWSVSYEAYVPSRYDLSLETVNGGIGIRGVHGQIRMSAVNGGLSLAGIGGDVQGETTNGGLDIRLSGDRWDGEGLDVETTNGGVELAIPRGYSARLETGTVNGGVEIDFPITVQGRLTREISTQLGSGGPTIRAVTTNGGVEVSNN